MNVDDIRKVGIVGAGLMGHGIAFSYAVGGYATALWDSDPAALDAAMAKIRWTADMFVEEKMLTRQEADAAVARIEPATSLAALAADADFVTEVIVERLEDKQRLFAELDELCRPHTILASNTSYFEASAFARDVSRPGKVVVTHYFAPPAVVPGVEVVKGVQTSDETFELTCVLMERINHVPIRVMKEMHGHLLNRLQRAMTTEALSMWAQGVASAEDIDLGVRTTFGFRTPGEGPMGHYDLARIWAWPPDTRLASAKGMVDDIRKLTNLSDADAARIVERYGEGQPWFSGPDAMDERIAEQTRALARRMRDTYWRGGRGQA